VLLIRKRVVTSFMVVKRGGCRLGVVDWVVVGQIGTGAPPVACHRGVRPAALSG
jgi:hypothetical protein